MIDDYGEGLYPDLLFYFNVDLTEVIAGRGPSPSLVLRLVQRLPDTSMTSALSQGGREYFGWGVDRHIQTDIYDALNVNTKATGQWKKGKAPDFPEWPRPKAKKKATDLAQKTRVTVKELFNQFTRR